MSKKSPDEFLAYLEASVPAWISSLSAFSTPSPVVEDPTHQGNVLEEQRGDDKENDTRAAKRRRRLSTEAVVDGRFNELLEADLKQQASVDKQHTQQQPLHSANENARKRKRSATPDDTSYSNPVHTNKSPRQMGGEHPTNEQIQNSRQPLNDFEEAPGLSRKRRRSRSPSNDAHNPPNPNSQPTLHQLENEQHTSLHNIQKSRKRRRSSSPPPPQPQKPELQIPPIREALRDQFPPTQSHSHSHAEHTSAAQGDNNNWSPAGTPRPRHDMADNSEPRSRASLEVVYDAGSQKSLEKVVDGIIKAKTLLWHTKAYKSALDSANRKQSSNTPNAVGTPGSGAFSNSGQSIGSRKSFLSQRDSEEPGKQWVADEQTTTGRLSPDAKLRRMRRGLSPSEHPSKDSSMSTNPGVLRPLEKMRQHLETAEDLCGKAAFQLLRDGNCGPEAATAAEELQKAKELADGEVSVWAAQCKSIDPTPAVPTSAPGQAADTADVQSGAATGHDLTSHQSSLKGERGGADDTLDTLKQATAKICEALEDKDLAGAKANRYDNGEQEDEEDDDDELLQLPPVRLTSRLTSS